MTVERSTTALKKDVVGNFVRLCMNNSANDIGNLIAEYVNESEHSGWEGYSSRDLTGIRRFLLDVMRYHDVTVKDDPNQYKEAGFSGAWYFTKTDGGPIPPAYEPYNK